MAFYSEDIIEEIRSRADIVDIISERVHLQKKGSTYFGLCPFHNEKSPSFSVTPSKGMYYCFGCGAGGNVFTFLQEYDNMSFPEAVRELASKTGVELPQIEMSEGAKRFNEEKDQIRAIYKAAAEHYYHMLRTQDGAYAYNYFKSRELTDDTMKQFGLGYCDKRRGTLYNYLKSKGFSDELMKKSKLIGFDEKDGATDRFFNRAMFPIFDDKSRVIAFGGRVMGEGDPKYLNSPDTDIFDKSKNMYAMQIAKKTRRAHFILCEGYMDVISLHQAGFDCAVASLGTAFTDGHANLLKRYGRSEKEIILSFDSDGAGQKACARAIPILRRAGLSCRVLSMTPYKDPDEFIKNLGAEEYEKRILDAVNWFIFLIRYESGKYNLKDPEGKTKFQKQIASLLIRYFDVEAERNNYLDAVCEDQHINREDIMSILRSMAKSGEWEKIAGESWGDEDEGAEEVVKKTIAEDSGPQQTQRAFLTLISEDIKAYDAVKQYLDVDDFDEGLYKEVASKLFEQCENNRVADPAAIASAFTDPEEHQTIAKMFNTRIVKQDVRSLLENGAEEEDYSEGQKSKALKELLIKLKESRIVKISTHMSEPGAALKMVELKQLLQKIRMMNFNY